LIALDLVGKRYGQRPSQLAQGALTDLLFDIQALNAGAKAEADALRRG
jgi:hypothetical protein